MILRKKGRLSSLDHLVNPLRFFSKQPGTDSFQVERRVGEDGRSYTRKEFMAGYGAYGEEWMDQPLDGDKNMQKARSSHC